MRKEFLKDEICFSSGLFGRQLAPDSSDGLAPHSQKISVSSVKSVVNKKEFEPGA
jgi:hypothetical protein